ncbi:alpha/beta hydrolase [Diaphorobacter sp. HDW4A]|uniref:alpha/beta fold hydrolase n=1 Tax=Diaphorobacter sp. HDW4A TaxID=2714924 RepID=UPI001408EB7F|nr:alpha/beta fold hydrolase [Diaphorobacter sp. HDW4A]QIL82120.1 alpha/beta hydrolase [Diaphorobacter sp. HDW4A]
MSSNLSASQDMQPPVQVQDHWVQTPQGRLFVREWSPAKGGARAPIIMFHDSLGAVSLWRDFPQALSVATGRTVYAYDRLGFGQSDARTDQPSLHFVFEEASKYFPRLREQLGITRFAVLGHSVGGGMAVCSAASAPQDCDAVITIGAQAFVEECTKQGIREAQSVYSDPVQFARLARYHGEKTRWVLDAWIESWLHPDFANWSIKDQLPLLRSPTLALHGELDEYGSAIQPEIISSLSGGEPSRMVLLTGLGHVPYREDSERVVQHIAVFLREHASR